MAEGKASKLVSGGKSPRKDGRRKSFLDVVRLVRARRLRRKMVCVDGRLKQKEARSNDMLLTGDKDDEDKRKMAQEMRQASLFGTTVLLTDFLLNF
eukprot:gene4869-5508_t